MEYHHVDVFSDRVLFGNGLTAVFVKSNFKDSTLLQIAQEFKQFETIFIYPKKDDYFPVRIFTVQEELPFAGHPLIGAAGILHKVFYPNITETEIRISLSNRIINLKSIMEDAICSVSMNQGKPEFIKSLNRNETIKLAKYFNLESNDINFQYPAQVVSTGLPYILVPLLKNLENAKINKEGLEVYIQKHQAKFVYLFDTKSLECRTWDNTGLFEDVATGSAAGPLVAYLVENKIKSRNGKIKISQGNYVGRPSTIFGWISEDETYEVFIEGKVAFFGKGEINI